MSNLTVENLTQIKGLGETKAQMIIDAVGTTNGSTSVDTLSEIKGVSNSLAQNVMNLIEGGVEAIENKPAPKTKAKAKRTRKPAAPKAKAKASTSRTAGDIREFASAAKSNGFNDVADALFEGVKFNLDSDKVDLSFSVKVG